MIIGDRVILTANVFSDTKYNPRWKGRYNIVGTITEFGGTRSVYVTWDNSCDSVYRPEHLTLYDPLMIQVDSLLSDI